MSLADGNDGMPGNEGRGMEGRVTKPSTIKFCAKLENPANATSNPNAAISLGDGENLAVKRATYEAPKPKLTPVAIQRPVPTVLGSAPLVIMGPETKPNTRAATPAGTNTLAWSKLGALEKDQSASATQTTANP